MSEVFQLDRYWRDWHAGMPPPLHTPSPPLWTKEEMEADSFLGPILEVGGSGKNCVKSTLPATAAVITLTNLPNPYTAISRNCLERNPVAILDWMLVSNTKTHDKLELAVKTAVLELSEGRSVRLECYGGRDRSQAVAWKVLQSLSEEVRRTVKLKCLDASVMEGLAEFVHL